MARSPLASLPSVLKTPMGAGRKGRSSTGLAGHQSVARSHCVSCSARLASRNSGCRSMADLLAKAAYVTSVGEKGTARCRRLARP